MRIIGTYETCRRRRWTLLGECTCTQRWQKRPSIEWPHSGRTLTTRPRPCALWACGARRRLRARGPARAPFDHCHRKARLHYAQRNCRTVPSCTAANQPANQSASPPCHADLLPCRPSAILLIHWRWQRVRKRQIQRRAERQYLLGTSGAHPGARREDPGPMTMPFSQGASILAMPNFCHTCRLSKHPLGSRMAAVTAHLGCGTPVRV